MNIADGCTTRALPTSAMLVADQAGDYLTALCGRAAEDGGRWSVLEARNLGSALELLYRRGNAIGLVVVGSLKYDGAVRIVQAARNAAPGVITLRTCDNPGLIRMGNVARVDDPYRAIDVARIARFRNNLLHPPLGFVSPVDIGHFNRAVLAWGKLSNELTREVRNPRVWSDRHASRDTVVRLAKCFAARYGGGLTQQHRAYEAWIKNVEDAARPEVVTRRQLPRRFM